MEGVVGNIMDIFFDIIGEKVLGEGYRKYYGYIF